MAARDSIFGSNARYRLFTALKYVVYALLGLNAWLFLLEERTALTYTFTGDASPAQLVQAFSATIDTVAWLLLVLLFELETAVLDDRRIHGALRWSLHGLRLLCYLAVVYAFAGYCAELEQLYRVLPLQGFHACDALGEGLSLHLALDEYAPLDALNCTSVGTQVYRLEGLPIVSPPDTLNAARALAWTDVANAAAWLLVVILLEVEVRLQLRGKLSGRTLHAMRVGKYLVYATLFLCAVYWGYAGDFLDFWDAFLWLFAFIFIELNVFEWQYETSHPAGAIAAAEPDA